MKAGRKARVSIAAAVCLAAATGCLYYLRGSLVGASSTVYGHRIDLRPPLGLPPVPVPPENPLTAEKVALGRKLFYDRRLSFNDSLSCSSCHNPFLGFADGKVHSMGAGGKIGVRNAPSIVNAVYDRLHFWDGRAASLEAQVGSPMANATEMNQPHGVAVSKLKADPVYRQEFESAFGPGPVAIDKIEKALASFERTLISANSPFDRYQFGGDKSALSPAAERGLIVFQDPQRGNCASCHTISRYYALFTDGEFHNTGEGVNETGELTDFGRFDETKKEADRGSFKTPSLRNVAESAPYMHDGALKTLKDVVDFYAGGGNSNAGLDPKMKAIHLTAADRADLVEFLKTLSGEPPANAGPPPAQK